MTVKRFATDDGLYECPHCNRKGLKLIFYGEDEVWECVRCGAELWYCESVEEMKQRCNEIKNGGNTRMSAKRFEYNHIKGYDDYIYDVTDNRMMWELDCICELLNNLHEENEQLKQELQTYHKVVGCFNCNYHNYDWFDDGDEFEVCDKGNDVTECICEEWEEL